MSIDAEKEPMTADQVREMADCIGDLCSQFPQRSSRVHWLDGMRKSLSELAEDMSAPAGRHPFTYNVTPMMLLRVQLSETLKDAFEAWLYSLRSEIHHQGGGGCGGGRGWSMAYYFDETSVPRVVEWLRERGAEMKTEAELEAAREAERKAEWAKRRAEESR